MIYQYDIPEKEMTPKEKAIEHYKSCVKDMCNVIKEEYHEDSVEFTLCEEAIDIALKEQTKEHEAHIMLLLNKQAKEIFEDIEKLLGQPDWKKYNKLKQKHTGEKE